MTPAVADSASPAAPELVLRLQDPSINESSGLAVSLRHRGVVWTHNDGGTEARVFALDRNGRTRATITLRGIDPFDPEALAPGRGPHGESVLFLADIGDNRQMRRDVSVFRFAEPARVADQTVAADWFRLRYPDGAHDAEALLVDPRDGRLWIATKNLLSGGLYRAPARMSTQRPNLLERVAAVPGLVTDGAFLPDGRFVLRSYATAYVFRSPGEVEAEAALPPQEQGESLAIDGDALLVGSEGPGAPVYAVPVPQASATPSTSPTPASSATPSPDPRSAGGGDDAGPSTSADEPRPVAFAAIGAGIVLLVLVASVRGWRGRRRKRAR